jgi:hypothetical protein
MRTHVLSTVWFQEGAVWSSAICSHHETCRSMVKSEMENIMKAGTSGLIMVVRSGDEESAWCFRICSSCMQVGVTT